MRVAVIWDNIGPYHRARLEAVGGGCELLAIEVRSKSRDYAWEGAGRACQHRVVTLLPDGEERGKRGVASRVASALEGFAPEVVMIPGWSSWAAIAGLWWCVRRGRAAVAMCESGEGDEQRQWWREWIKRRVVRQCASALAGGRVHADYLERLGMERERIFLGYDAVDNEYFERGTRRVRNEANEWRGRYGLPEHFFLASARFIAKKNLPWLLEGFAHYRASGGAAAGWDLVLLGDGPLRQELEAAVRGLKPQGRVRLAGFKQYSELPVYYGLAGAFVHASTSEPWGLVVNEAMASGLPVIVSNRCGCAPELVREGMNGYTFEPRRAEELGRLLGRVAGLEEGERLKMGETSRGIIAEWGLRRFASGFRQACEAGLKSRVPSPESKVQSPESKVQSPESKV